MGEFAGEINLGSADLLSSGGKDVFVLQYSATKQLLWAKSFGDSANQGGKRVAVDSSGNIVIGGYAAGQIDFGQGALSATGDFDAFVAKLSPAGEPVWSRLLGSDQEDITWSVAVTPAMETLAVCTTRAEAADFGTGPLPGGGNGTTRRLVVAKLGR
jgi:hypothetical protein